MAEIRDEDVLQMVEVAGVDPDVASEYLRMTEGDVEGAISIYLAASDSGAAPGRQTASAQSGPVRSSSSEALNVVPNDSELPEATDAHSDDFVSTATSNTSRPNAWTRSLPLHPPEPSRPSNRILSDPFRYPSSRDARMGVMGGQRDMLDFADETARAIALATGQAGIGRTGDTDPFRNPEDEAAMLRGGNDFEATDKLAELFRPPYDIMSHGSLDHNRNKAKIRRKWLIVNVQDQLDFQCQILNRDLWSEKPVKDLIRQHFIFVQWASTSTDGSSYRNFYPINKFPVIDVLDPRTGEQVKRYNEIVMPEEFIKDMTEFTSTNSLESDDAVVTPSTSAPRPPIDMLDLTEEEQTRIAMEESMRQANASKDTNESDDSKSNDGIQEDVVFVDALLDGMTSGLSTKGKERETDVQSLKPELVGSLPPNEPSTTRVQIKYPNGTREVVRLHLSDPVVKIFRHVKAKYPDAASKSFQIIYVRKSLGDDLSATIEDLDLQNGSLSVTLTE